MCAFLIEGHVVAIDANGLMASRRAAMHACVRLANQRHTIRYLEGLYVVAEERHLCLVDDVDEAGEARQVRDRLIEVSKAALRCQPHLISKGG